jgi:hypothetical protein
VLLMTADTRQSVACLSGRRIVEVMEDLGVRSVLLDDPTPLDLACKADVPVDVNLDDWAAVEGVLRREHRLRPLEAVLSVYDAHLPLAAYLAARLGVRGTNVGAALALHDKIRMRMVLAAANGRSARTGTPAGRRSGGRSGGRQAARPAGGGQEGHRVLRPGQPPVP